VWQKGLLIASAIYGATRSMPREEAFGLTSQMRRAACSISLNIAEGFGQRTRPKFIPGLRTAVGSLYELMTAYQIATDLRLIMPDHAILAMLKEEDLLLSSLIAKLEAKDPPATRRRRS